VSKYKKFWPEFREEADPAALAEIRPADLARAITDPQQLVPLIDYVVDDLIDRFRDRLNLPEGRAIATRYTAALMVKLAGDDVARQISRAASRIGILPSTMIAAVVDAISPGDDCNESIAEGSLNPVVTVVRRATPASIRTIAAP
jgi:hypothetical protein